MKTLINLSCLSLLFLSSCKEPTIKGVVVDTDLNLIVKDVSGKNLLDPSTPGYYKPEEIRIYYLKEGRKQEVFNPNLDAPRNFKVIKNEGNNEYYVRVFVNEGTTDQEVTTTYIQWQSGQEDTIRSLITRSPTTIYCDKVWYNELLKYDRLKSVSETDWGNGKFRRLLEITQKR